MGDCCSKPNDQFDSYIKERTSYILWGDNDVWLVLDLTHWAECERCYLIKPTVWHIILTNRSFLLLIPLNKLSSTYQFHNLWIIRTGSSNIWYFILMSKVLYKTLPHQDGYKLKIYIFAFIYFRFVVSKMVGKQL